MNQGNNYFYEYKTSPTLEVIKVKINDVEDETFKTIYNEWKNSGAPGPETMAAGGKIRSFDFVEQGDTPVAVPKLT